MIRHRIIVTGGGTGGHIYPALAVADCLKDAQDVEAILYFGAKGHLEEKIAKQNGIAFMGLSVSGLPRHISPALVGWTVQFVRSVFEADRLLRKFRPTVVLGTGGYASAPPLVAAWMNKIPFAVHEPDAHPGLVNRMLAPQATLVSLGMEGALNRIKKARGKIVVNGNPIAKGFSTLLRRDAACAVLGLDPSLKTVLITGGSQGAQAINEAVFAALPQLLELDPHIQVVHQIGHKNFLEYRERLDPAIAENKRYVLRAYFDDLALAYAACDLTICRAGAMTIAELASTGTPAIFIPHPTVTADHQSQNANFVASRGAACVIAQSTLTGDILFEQVRKLITDDEALKQMRAKMLLLGRPRAASDLASQVIEVSTAFQMSRNASALSAHTTL